jgi:DNA polymerase (family 10)
MKFKDIADVFYSYALLYKKENIYKSLAYSSAANILAKTPNTIANNITLSQTKLTKNMIDKALNIRENGDSYSELMSIPGIGLAKAKQLIDLGVTKTSDLKLKKYKDLLSTQSQLYIKLHPKPLTRELIAKIENSVISGLEKNIIFVGSYRREKPISRDIDIVYCGVGDDILQKIQQLGKVYIYAHGKSKISMYFDASKILSLRTICKIDIFLVNEHNYIPTILYTTGSKDFNVMMRQKAKELGYLLNQFGLFKGKKQIELKTEADYFKILNINYRLPKDR